MLLMILKRILLAVPTLLGVSLIIFCLVRMTPGDPIEYLAPVDASPETISSLKTAYGLDRPLYVQYTKWLGHLLTGDMGASITTGDKVLPNLLDALVNTALIALPAALLGFMLGVALGTIAASFRGRMLDRLASAVSISGVSVPHYWVAMVLVILFSVELAILPAQGKGFEGLPGSLEDLSYLVLPVVALSLIPMGIVARMTRTSLLDILSQDYIGALKAKGLLRRRIVGHAIKNAAPGLLSVMGLQLGYLLSGSILVETIFNWPGAGSLLNSAIFRRDIPVLQATVVVLASIFVMLNVAVDIARSLIDVRLRS